MTTTETDTGEHQDTLPYAYARASGLVPESERDHLKVGVCARLVWLRKRAGMSQDRAGALAGISIGGLSKLERGVNRPTKDSLRDLAAVYAPHHPRIEYWNLCKLAGDSLRASHRRLSPVRKPLTVQKAAHVLQDAQRAVSRAGKVVYGMPSEAGERSMVIAKAFLEGAERDMEVALARQALIDQLTAAGPANTGENVG